MFGIMTPTGHFFWIETIRQRFANPAPCRKTCKFAPPAVTFVDILATQVMVMCAALLWYRLTSIQFERFFVGEIGVPQTI